MAAFRKKIVLINPPLSLHERYGSLKAAGNSLPNLGLCYLAAVAIEQGWDVKIIDCPALQITIPNLVQMIGHEMPGIVGITASTPAIFNAHSSMKIIKKTYPDMLTLIGGPHISSIPRAFQELDSFDIAVLGEGELTLKDILDYAEGKKDLEQIDGIAYRINGVISFTQSRAPITNIDMLPFPAWDLLQRLNKFYRPSLQCVKQLPATILVTSRGCPYRCAFCDHSVFGYNIRYHGCKYVIDMIKYLFSKYRIKEFAIHDECLFTVKERAIDFLNAIVKERLKISWTVQARVDQVDIQLLTLLKKTGCWQIQLGIESGSERILKILNKDISKDQIFRVCRLIKEVGLSLKGFFMLGNPGETEDTIQETFDLALQLPLDDFQCTFFTPYPGCRLYKEVGRWGTLDNVNFSEMNQYNIVFLPFGLSKSILKKEFKNGYRRFYLRPRIILNYLKRMREPSLWNSYVKGIMGFIKFSLLPS